MGIRSIVAVGVAVAGLAGCIESNLPLPAREELVPAEPFLWVPRIFGDHMVVQRDMPIRVWGRTTAETGVAVEFAGQTMLARSGRDGRWSVGLGPLTAGGPHEMAITSGDLRLVFRDVLVGEVWLCSGQSNMDWKLRDSQNAKEFISQARRPEIRLFTVAKTCSLKPREDCEGRWVICTRKEAAQFSAVGYHFGRRLQEHLGLPVGLIRAAWGGTPAEAWVSRSALEGISSYSMNLERWDKLVEEYPKRLEEYERVLTRNGPSSGGRDEIAAPFNPVYEHHPASLFNGMIHPIIPYSIRGVLWYQGENNVGRGYQYQKLFPGLIADWRRRWGQGDFPFLFVQLANCYETDDVHPRDPHWAELREAQLKTLAVPRTGMAVAIDLGEARDIHPRNKDGVAERLFLVARKVAYGEEPVYSGPLYQSAKVEGRAIRLAFDHVGGGLKAKGGEAPAGFVIAGLDRKFIPAQARIDGESVVVWSDGLKSPIAVRYAWADNPVCNLYNAEGLPASPFRTDDWPLMSLNNLHQPIFKSTNAAE